MKHIYILLIAGFSFFSSLEKTLAFEATPPFWYNQFSSSFPSGWTSSDLSGQGVEWEYCEEFFDCPPTSFSFIECNASRFQSPSVEDGYLFVNSLAAGNLPVPHEAVLTTPEIDCSSKDAVFLRFYTYISALNFNPRQHALVEVKAGTGDWQAFTVFPNLDISVAERRESWNPRQVLLDISEVAANQPGVQIRWKWKGNGELFWAIDDVALFEQSPLLDRVIWGDQPGEGDFGNGLNGWAVSNVLDTCRWVWDAVGEVHFPDANPKADFWPCSPTAFNGVAMMNPTWCIAQGGPSQFTHSELRSPVIDLSSAGTGKRLSLNFFQAFMKGNAASVNFPLSSVMFSPDAGQSWPDTLALNVREAFSDPICGELSVSIPDAFVGASQFMFKFVFSGNSFFWIIDDVRILEKEDHDLAIVPSFVAAAPNFSTPAAMVGPVGFAVDLRNEGNAPQSQVLTRVAVKPDELAAPVFQDSLFVGELLPGAVYDNEFFAKQFTPPAEPGQYVIRYSVEAADADAVPENNSKDVHFRVSENFFSKDPGNCSVNGFFAASEDLRYEIGNCYFVAKGEDYCASELEFSFRNATLLEGANLTIQLYQWKKDGNWGDVNNDTIANPDEYELLAFNTYQVNGLEDGSFVKVPLSFDSECVPLEDSTYYFVTVAYPEPVLINGLGVPFFIGASEEVDYTAMFWLSYHLGVPQYVSMLRLGNDDYFRANGWGLLRVPAIRMYVDQLNASLEPDTESKVSLKISPNPARDILRVDLSEKMSIVNGSLEIFDYCGHLLHSQGLESPFVSNLPVNIEGLPAGCYILRLVSENLTLQTRFVVQH
jgi:hypothetical protein